MRLLFRRRSLPDYQPLELLKIADYKASDLCIGGADHHNDKDDRIDEHTVICQIAVDLSQGLRDICQDYGGDNAAPDIPYTAKDDEY